MRGIGFQKGLRVREQRGCEEVTEGVIEFYRTLLTGFHVFVFIGCYSMGFRSRIGLYVIQDCCMSGFRVSVS